MLSTGTLIRSGTWLAGAAAADGAAGVALAVAGALAAASTVCRDKAVKSGECKTRSPTPTIPSLYIITVREDEVLRRMILST